jgi:hypothetical protein
MEVAAPSSRSPQGMRGTSLRMALRELGNGEETPPAQSAVVPRAVPLAPSLDRDAPDALDDDDEPPPPALRPQELARRFRSSE